LNLRARAVDGAETATQGNDAMHDIFGLPSLSRGGRRVLAAAGLALLHTWLPGCRESAPDDLIQQEETTEAIVFLKTTGEESLNRSWAAGNLYKLSPISPDGRVTPITEFAGASISDPCVSFDGERILFSMRPAGESDRNIFEIDADGRNLRQITRGGGHDFDPLYLPDGKILFTSSRAGHMDEYNHSPAENLFTCNADGSGITRISFNQSDDFDPALLPNGRIAYTRWDHFGTFNRFPLFVTNPDGTGTFHEFGPHERNFFHAQPTPDGRLIAIESTEINEDAGPIAVLKLEQGPADPVQGESSLHWDVLTVNVNTDGEPWPYGAFKYPFPIGGNRFVVSYTLPAAVEEEVDYALYTFTLDRNGAGSQEDPATFVINDLTFLYNDPGMNEYDAQLLAPRERPPVIPSTVDASVDYGVFLAQDVFNRGSNDGQEVPRRDVDPIGKIAVIAARPTTGGEMNDFSANEFEKRALIGFAPVQPDGSFRIRVPADTPISFATLDEHDRGFVNKRTWLYVRPGEEFDQCVGCHEDRAAGGPVPTNPNPMAASLEPTDLNIPPDAFTVINYESDIGPIVASKCVTCHHVEYVERDSLVLPDSVYVTVIDTLAAPGDLDLSAEPDTTDMERVFPRGYVNLSGESESMDHQVVSPGFPRRSLLIDYVLGLGERASLGPHPDGEFALTEEERARLNYWVLLGAQYK
jgi:hypothetical protein